MANGSSVATANKSNERVEAAATAKANPLEAATSPVLDPLKAPPQSTRDEVQRGRQQLSYKEYANGIKVYNDPERTIEIPNKLYPSNPVKIATAEGQPGQPYHAIIEKGGTMFFYGAGKDAMLIFQPKDQPATVGISTNGKPLEKSDTIQIPLKDGGSWRFLDPAKEPELYARLAPAFNAGKIPERQADGSFRSGNEQILADGSWTDGRGKHSVAISGGHYSVTFDRNPVPGERVTGERLAYGRDIVTFETNGARTHKIVIKDEKGRATSVEDITPEKLTAGTAADLSRFPEPFRPGVQNLTKIQSMLLDMQAGKPIDPLAMHRLFLDGDTQGFMATMSTDAKTKLMREAGIASHLNSFHVPGLQEPVDKTKLWSDPQYFAAVEARTGKGAAFYMRMVAREEYLSNNLHSVVAAESNREKFGQQFGAAWNAHIESLLSDYQQAVPQLAPGAVGSHQRVDAFLKQVRGQR